MIPDIDVDLELAPRGKPGFVRRPDLIVVHDATVERARREGGILRACDVLVIVEIVSPGSHRTDHVIKRGEYADAGIPHYWIVDLDHPVTLTDCHLAAELGYQDAGPRHRPVRHHRALPDLPATGRSHPPAERPR